MGRAPEPTGDMSRMVENINLQRALLRRLGSMHDVDLYDKLKVSAIERQGAVGSAIAPGDWPLVHLSDGRTLRARLLVSNSLLCMRFQGAQIQRLKLGWRRWVQLSCSFVCTNPLLRMGLRHACSGGHLIPRPSTFRATVSPKYNRVSTLPSDRTNRVPSCLPYCILARLVDEATARGCAPGGRPRSLHTNGQRRVQIT